MALSFSASSSTAGQSADALRRQNSTLRAQIAGKLSNSEIQAVAAQLGLVMPTAGSIRYLDASPADAKTAAERLANGELIGTGGVGPGRRAHRVRRAGDRPGRGGRRSRRRRSKPRPSKPRDRSRRPRSRPRRSLRRRLPPPGHRADGDGRSGRRAVSLIDRRVGLLFAASVVLLGLVLIRAVWVQGVTGGSLSAEAQGQQIETVVVPGSRGTIYDRTGRELAVSEDAATVFATPYQVKDPEEAAHKLAKVLDLDQEEVLESLADRELGLRLHRAQGRPPRRRGGREARPGRDRDAPRQPPHLPAGRARRAGDRHGRDREPGPDRARVLRGRAPPRRRRRARGDPRRARRRARARHGRRRRDRRRTWSSPSTPPCRPRPSACSPRSARPTPPTARPRSSWTPAPPRSWRWPTGPASIPPTPRDATPQELANMATGFTYEPGSTFKAFTVAGALEQGLVTPTTMFDLPPTIQVADRVIEESHDARLPSASRSPTSWPSPRTSARSRSGSSWAPPTSTSGSASSASASRPGSSSPARSRGSCSRSSEYSGSTMGNLPIGQGLSVTPMQMAAGYAAIANGGVLRVPRLVSAEDGEPVAEDHGHAGDQPSDGERAPDDARGRARAGRHRRGGERSRLHAGRQDRHRAEGGSETGTYSETEFVASFVGFAPAEDPQLLVAIVVDNPKGDYYGGTVAAPAFGEIAQFALPYLRIPRAIIARWSFASCSPAPTWSRSSATRRPRSPPSPTTAARRARERCSSRPRVHRRRARLRPAGGAGGRDRGGRRAAARARAVRGPGGGRRRARGDGARGGALLRRSRPPSCAWSGSPAPTARRRPPSWSATSSSAPGSGPACSER